MQTEREALMACLDMQRFGVLRIVEAMSDEALRASVLPSGWTCLGMIQHLTLNERYWFRWGVAGEWLPGIEIVDGRCRVVLADMPDPGDEWKVAPHVEPETILKRYRAEVVAANQAIASADLDAPPVNADAWWANFGDGAVNLRWIVLHMIEETAQHAGHLDIVKELTDVEP